MLRVNTTSGQHVYWLQNVFSFFTNNDTAYFLDNVWNSSAPGAVLDANLLSGSGSVYSVGSRNYYAAATNVFSYVAPLTVKFPISVSHSANKVVVSFGYQEASGGSPLTGPTNSYDSASITEPGTILDAAIVVSGYEMEPGGDFFDAELVFAGQCCLAVTNFSSMDSTLSLSYTLLNGDVSAPKAVYEFGSDTGEAAFGIKTARSQNTFHVGLGSVDFSANYVIGAPVPVFLTFSYSVTDGSHLANPPVLTLEMARRCPPLWAHRQLGSGSTAAPTGASRLS
jgi:hypothetical protein